MELNLRRITDGLSKTALLGEVRQFAGFDARGLLYLGTAFYEHTDLPNSNGTDFLEWCAEFNGPGRRIDESLPLSCRALQYSNVGKPRPVPAGRPQSTSGRSAPCFCRRPYGIRQR